MSHFSTRHAILFDFDGTIADTFDALLAATNRLAPEFGYEPTDPQTAKHLQALTTRELIQRSGISIFKLPRLLRRLRVELRVEIPRSRPFPDIDTTLKTLKRQGHYLGIVTSNSADNVSLFLDRWQLSDLFDEIYTGATLFGKSRILRKLLAKTPLDPATTLYVGDETRDIAAAKKVGIQIASATWGFNAEALLVAESPNFVIRHPTELLQVVAQVRSRPTASR